MPMGESDFRDVINNKFVYIDKTLLAKELLDSSDKVTLITRPRRWGKVPKSLNVKLKIFKKITKQKATVHDSKN